MTLMAATAAHDRFAFSQLFFSIWIAQNRSLGRFDGNRLARNGQALSRDGKEEYESFDAFGMSFASRLGQKGNFLIGLPEL